MGNKSKRELKTTKKQQPKFNQQKKTYTVYLLAFFCFLFAFILYSNTFKHSYVLDDNSVLANNWVVKKGFQGIPTLLKTTYRFGENYLNDNLYRPISQIMFAIEWQISPNNPHLSHIINVLFYALSCFLLFMVMHKYFSKVHVLIPFLITFLYIAHPIHTEVVANIKSRDEIMSFFFLMITLLLLFEWYEKKKIWYLLLSLGVYFLAFLSKEGVITMLFVFPLIGWYFTDTKPKTIISTSLLLVIPALLYIIIRYQIIDKNNVATTFSVIDNFLEGATSPASHFATAVMLLGKYLLLSVIPYQLICDYSYNQIEIVGLTDLKFILSFIIYFAIFIYCIINIRKKNYVVFGVLFYLMSISIYSNIFFHIGTSFGERLLFLPSLGICIAFVFFILKILKVEIYTKSIPYINILKSKPLFPTLIILIILIFSVKTIVRASQWENEIVLFNTDIKSAPNSARLCLYLGEAIYNNSKKIEDKSVRDNQTLEAVSYFDKGLTIYPNFHECFEQLSSAWYQLKDINKALLYANQALKLNPTNADTWYNTGIIYFDMKNYQKAMECYEKAVSINPQLSDAYLNMGSILGNLGKFDDAIIQFKKCLQYDSGNVNAMQFIALCYQKLNQQEEAQKWLLKANNTH